MKALFAIASTVPLARVLRDHRRWVFPLTLVLAINAGVLIFVVLPLTQAVRLSESRARTASEAQAAAAADLKSAEAVRDGQVQATGDLDRFYRQVLPVDVSAARRITNLKLSQLARKHNVEFQRSSATPEETRGSDLERLRVSYEFSGDYDDVRQLIYDIETAPDFIVIYNMALGEGQDSQAPLSLMLELSTYFRMKPYAR
jgi:Tfp pilus assembly protein PilO